MSKKDDEYQLVKRLGDDNTVTEEQAAELLRCQEDINYFARNYVMVQNPSEGAILFDPYNYQQDMFEMMDKERFSIIVAPRQCGKTASTTVYLLHQMIFFEDIRIGISANKMDQAKEIVERIKYAYEELPFWMKPAVKEYNVFRLLFDNKSSCEAGATTKSGLRGKSFRIIYLDEFAHIEPAVQEPFWTSLLPTISGGAKGGKSNTKIVISSTPNGTEGLFASIYHEAMEGVNGFTPFEVNWRDVPGRDDEFKRSMMSKMTEEKYMQEFENAWISSKGTLISSRKLESIRTQTPIEVTMDGLDVFAPVKGRRLAVGCDVGAGVGADFSVVEVFDVETLEQVAEYRDNTLSLTDFTKKIVKILTWLDDNHAKEIFYTVEANSIGQGVITLLENSTYSILKDVEFISEYGKKHRGILTTNKNKVAGCSKFKDLVELDKMTLKSRKLVSELKFFIQHGASFQAEKGMHDDHVMACVLVVNMLAEISNFDEAVYESMVKMQSIDCVDDEYDPLPVL